MVTIITPRELRKFERVDITQEDDRWRWDFALSDTDVLADAWENDHQYAILLDGRLYECGVVEKK